MYLKATELLPISVAKQLMLGQIGWTMAVSTRFEASSINFQFVLVLDFDWAVLTH